MTKSDESLVIYLDDDEYDSLICSIDLPNSTADHTTETECPSVKESISTSAILSDQPILEKELFSWDNCINNVLEQHCRGVTLEKSQREIITSILNNRDALAVIPGDKSILYQVKSFDSIE